MSRLSSSTGGLWIFFLLWILFSGQWACTPVRYYGPDALTVSEEEAQEEGQEENQAEAQEEAREEGKKVNEIQAEAEEREEEQDRPLALRRGARESGIASFMADETHGRKTASGELFDMHQLVAAHLTLPFDSVVLVRNLANGREVEVRINDRGPFVKGRIIDLSFEAAKQLGLVERGRGRVEIEVIRIGRE